MCFSGPSNPPPPPPPPPPMVDESAVQANHVLRDGDLVSFQKGKVESGS